MRQVLTLLIITVIFPCNLPVKMPLHPLARRLRCLFPVLPIMSESYSAAICACRDTSTLSKRTHRHCRHYPDFPSTGKDD